MFGKIKEVLSLDRWIENFEGYLDARIELAKYDIKEALIEVLIKSVAIFIAGIFGFCGLICLNFALGYLLNYLIGFPFAGFFILTIFYGLSAWFIYSNRDNKAWREKLENNFRQSLKQPKEEKPETEKNDA